MSRKASDEEIGAQGEGLAQERSEGPDGLVKEDSEEPLDEEEEEEAVTMASIITVCTALLCALVQTAESGLLRSNRS